MSTAFVECWKCDECGHRWIKTEVWPSHCASSKCRKRSWNKLGQQGKASAPPANKPVGPAPPDKPAAPNMPALREICAGNRTAIEGEVMQTFQLETTQGIDLEVNFETGEVIDRTFRCLVCESKLVGKGGKWACVDVSCGKYGVEQKVKA